MGGKSSWWFPFDCQSLKIQSPPIRDPITSFVEKTLPIRIPITEPHDEQGVYFITSETKGI